MKQILSITNKELESYFGSPLSVIFMGTFLAAVLFIFFTIETFFARGIADVRPMFEWMPVLLIFLLAALTMRQWSEEQRSGTIEILLTLPVKTIHLVLGKFLAVMAIIALSLLLTIFLPLTVSILGNLDWGPVFGGYLAALLMASAYAAIGLFVSSRTDNQIVALISTILLGGLFYIIGSTGITDFVGGGAAEILRAIGTGSRFESIERGVIDLRDLIYYLSLTGIFLTLNTISLDSVRWSQKQQSYQQKLFLTVSLLCINMLLANVWLYPLHGLRLDLTEQREYTISQTTKDLLLNLQEPLLIRAYISEQSHPLLSPLAPQINDMLREYEIASEGMVTAEVVDPIKDPEIEAEANQTYGIRPTPFQIAGRHESSVINAYFDILIRYGDQSVVLNFQEMIEIVQTSTGVNVRLRNLEYDLTRAIKKVVYGFQSVDSVLAALDNPVNLTLYITPDQLPQQLAGAEDLIQKVATEIQDNSDGKLIFQQVNPDDPNSPVDRQTLIENYGLQPYPVALFSPDTYFFHMVLESEEGPQFLYPPGDVTEAEIRTAIESALKRTSSGFLKEVGVWSPPETAQPDMFGQMQQPLSTYQLVREQLSSEYKVTQVDLSTGEVPAGIDVLVLVAPKGMGDKELFAIDQYLMRGGSVVVAYSKAELTPDPYQGTLAMTPIEDGVTDLLESYGINFSDGLVMDMQNDAFPITVARDVGGIQVQEIQAIDYPFFVDVRSDNMNLDNPVTLNLSAVTLNWATAVSVDEEKNADRDSEVLLSSSPQAWLYDGIEIQPDFDQYPELGFEINQEKSSYPLAVSVQGSFESYFKGKPNPFQSEEEKIDATSLAGPDVPGETDSGQEDKVVATIEESPTSSRLVVIGSGSFVDDFVLQLSARLSQDRYLNNLRLLQNAVDWTVEDLDLLSIRGRGSYTRVLIPLSEGGQTTWEVINYIIALAALLAIYFFYRIQKRNEKPIELVDAGSKKSKE